MNPEKLQKLQQQVRIGGKGTPRRKVVKKAHKPVGGQEDKKLVTQLKKLGMQQIPGIEEVNMFTQTGTVIHVAQPKVQASVPSNLFAISGHAEEKELTELVPGILSQMGPESLQNLRKLAESYQAAMGQGAGAAAAGEAAQDDDVPDLVENFEEVSKE